MSKTTTFVVSLLAMTSGSVCAADWPSFRGPTGNGFSGEREAPTQWSAVENILWKAPLPRPGNGSAIVVAGHVFVTSAEDEEGFARSLYCFDVQRGQTAWVRTVEIEEVMPTHKTNPYCGTTPVSDGKRVVVWHGSAGLFCYDLDGNELWSRNFGEFRHRWGYGTSPIINGQHVILHTGPGKRVFVTALELETGKTIWETDEPIEGNGERREDDAPLGSWCTPTVAHVDGQDQIIVVMPTRVNAYDSDTGEIVWWCEGLRHERGNLAYSSAIIADDFCFVTGGYKGPSLAIRMGAHGDLTDSESQLWRYEDSPQSIGTGVFVEGAVYRPNAGPGTIECIDPETGDTLWTDRAAGGEHWGSMVVTGGLLYATNQDGITAVFRPNIEKYDPVSVNRLDEPTNATLAIANRHIFIRAEQHLYCIGE